MHLRRLLCRFRAQELSMTEVVTSLQAELETSHREVALLQQQGDDAGSSLGRCIDLQAQCDEIANELTHVRMAISGANEELAEHEGQFRPSRGHPARRATPA